MASRGDWVGSATGARSSWLKKRFNVAGIRGVCFGPRLFAITGKNTMPSNTAMVCISRTLVGNYDY